MARLCTESDLGALTRCYRCRWRPPPTCPWEVGQTGSQ